ncbi:Methyl-accepting chemotaxis protein III MCP-III; Ribose and galactose chemoreceptor protein [Salmonella enterica subsp. enterica]|nr:Methyl-accepting chemotaxis protein III MCP-III; Ribose and galactose chemoreceptor protein [Salmonella enterica subsp. enterica]
MGNTFSMQASHKLGFLHHIRLVPLFPPFSVASFFFLL